MKLNLFSTQSTQNQFSTFLLEGGLGGRISYCPLGYFFTHPFESSLNKKGPAGEKVKLVQDNILFLFMSSRCRPPLQLVNGPFIFANGSKLPFCREVSCLQFFQIYLKLVCFQHRETLCDMRIDLTHDSQWQFFKRRFQPVAKLAADMILLCGTTLICH